MIRPDEFQFNSPYKRLLVINRDSIVKPPEITFLGRQPSTGRTDRDYVNPITVITINNRSR